MKGSKDRILCIDDNQDTCFMFCTLLQAIGYEAMSATTVAEGLRLAKTEKYDLIMIDNYFEDGTGVGLCQMIRAFDPDVPVIFCSGAALDFNIEAAKRAGAQEYLVKPCSMEKLESTIALLINKKKIEVTKSGTEGWAKPCGH